MMKCENVHSVVEAWEEGTMTPGDMEFFRTHLETCGDCRRRFGALLPLMGREFPAGMDKTAGLGILAPMPLPAGLADDVMAAIGRRNHHRFVFSPMLAAAAAAIFVVGLGLGLFFAKQNSDVIKVTFSLDAPQASSVYLAGDFNAWSGKGYELRKAGADGTWEIMVPLEKGKVYVYNFVVDGTIWIADPAVPATIDDGFGGSGSLLRL
jgi:hypothetical protein